MEDLAKLQQSYSMHKLGVGDLSDGIAWAIDRLCLDQEGDDLDIVLLAGASTTEEAAPYVATLVARYCTESDLDPNLAAGKYVVKLHHRYLAGSESVASLDTKFDQLYQKLGYPDWMTMLSRNCEYATDVPAFHKPFEREFHYIAGLWAEAHSRRDFEGMYSREVSNQHDVK